MPSLCLKSSIEVEGLLDFTYKSRKALLAELYAKEQLLHVLGQTIKQDVMSIRQHVVETDLLVADIIRYIRKSGVIDNFDAFLQCRDKRPHSRLPLSECELVKLTKGNYSSSSSNFQILLAVAQNRKGFL
jgi:hypothetical protein